MDLAAIPGMLAGTSLKETMHNDIYAKVCSSPELLPHLAEASRAPAPGSISQVIHLQAPRQFLIPRLAEAAHTVASVFSEQPLAAVEIRSHLTNDLIRAV